MKSVTTYQAKRHLSALLREISQGAEIEIRRGDKAIARLVPAEPGARRRRPRVGTVTSALARYDADAFAPLDEAGMKELGLL
jgi:antitoxin (DNA-binding transcriptional repressor) of toxin-antitoxin stability system